MLRRGLVLLPLILLVVPSLALAERKPKRDKQKVSADAVIERAHAAVAAGTADPARDLQPLLDLLLVGDEYGDVGSIVRAIEELGDYEEWSPGWVKQYFREKTPGQVIALLERQPPFESIGGAVLMLRSLNIDEAAIDAVVAATEAYRGPDTHAAFQGRLLADWRDRRPANPVVATDPAREKAALDRLREKKIRLNPWQLSDTARAADSATLALLLDGGMETPGIVTQLLALATMGGQGEQDGLARIATIDLLLARGADIRYKDGYDNTLPMAAVQGPVPVMAKLLEAGAELDAINSRGLSALHMALMQNRWDMAEFLVGLGARSSQEAIDKIFYEKPTDPEKLDLLRRATAPPARPGDPTTTKKAALEAVGLESPRRAR